MDCRKPADNEGVTPYQLLANAIVEQAANDYRKALKHDNERMIADLERFFRSGWYQVLTDVDGEWLIQKMRKEFGKGEDF